MRERLGGRRALFQKCEAGSFGGADFCRQTAAALAEPGMTRRHPYFGTK
ncbi:hypothetical protein TPHV1_50026 [Treponema phagedenis]|uniref:Uncharacterized protein n=1 Tax=Treponema phagedenis TaxID=162 RepID=A0A0B7H1C3_TREPH|nr:hypothetical protein TPHV1_50026 [Treponema phagedenis]